MKLQKPLWKNSVMMKIIELEEVDSTNEYCKRIDNGQDLIVTATRQTDGRGTKGRSFVSADGGLYVTVMHHSENFNTAQAFKIMVGACVAVCKTVENFGLNPIIRWANDVLVGGKKVCGTLIENTFSGNKITRSVIGMGLNINNELPSDLQPIATSMCEELKKTLCVKQVRDLLLNNLQKNYTVRDYKNYINWFGKPVILKMADGESQVIAVDVDDYGNLICSAGGALKKVSCAEVSLRL